MLKLVQLLMTLYREPLLRQLVLQLASLRSNEAVLLNVSRETSGQLTMTTVDPDQVFLRSPRR